MPENRRAETTTELSREERLVLNYFLENISVGEIIAIKDLKAMYGLENPERIIVQLITKGYLVRGEGCYTLAPELRRKITSKRRF